MIPVFTSTRADLSLWEPIQLHNSLFATESVRSRFMTNVPNCNQPLFPESEKVIGLQEKPPVERLEFSNDQSILQTCKLNVRYLTIETR